MIPLAAPRVSARDLEVIVVHDPGRPPLLDPLVEIQ